jgi:hypothetical protein
LPLHHLQTITIVGHHRPTITRYHNHSHTVSRLVHVGTGHGQPAARLSFNSVSTVTSLKPLGQLATCQRQALQRGAGSTPNESKSIQQVERSKPLGVAAPFRCSCALRFMVTRLLDTGSAEHQRTNTRCRRVEAQARNTRNRNRGKKKGGSHLVFFRKANHSGTHGFPQGGCVKATRRVGREERGRRQKKSTPAALRN